MNALEQNVVSKFVRGYNASQSNTRSIEGLLLLRGNAIAWRNPETGELWISNHGYHTKTTQSRLNAVIESAAIEARVFTKDGAHHLERWEDGELTVTPMGSGWVEIKLYHLQQVLTELTKRLRA
tara:strand:- start:610 stop:981 length:372 start_codon:yes stop_codon:yes gene_type:complete